MKIYLYDTVTGEYLDTIEARPNPEEPGRFLIPSGATDQPPIPRKKGHLLKFDGKRWVNIVK